jgi:hypothetical protein
MLFHWVCRPKMGHKKKIETPQLDINVLQIMFESKIILCVPLLPQKKHSTTLNMRTTEKLITLLFVTHNSKNRLWPRSCGGVKGRIG